MITTILEGQTAHRFARDVANHELTIKRDDGLYRHLRLMRPGSSSYWFDIVTWPGALTIRGDIGESYTFARTTDMFQFFRSDSGRINPHYWSQKLPDYGRSVRAYSEDALMSQLDEHLAEYEKEYPGLHIEYLEAWAEFELTPKDRRWPQGTVKEPAKPKEPREIRQLIKDFDTDGELGHDDGARRLLKELEGVGLLSDTWEWSLADWKWEFLWACHAIVWGIAQYDAAKTVARRARRQRWARTYLRATV